MLVAINRESSRSNRPGAFTYAVRLVKTNYSYMEKYLATLWAGASASVMKS